LGKEIAMKYTALVESYIAEKLVYDPTTGVLSRRLKTRIKPIKTLSSDGYVVVGILGSQYRVHKVAWYMHYGVWPDKDLDHINCTRSDNRIENLRLCDDSQNQANKRKFRGTSSYKGVDYHGASGLWRARIRKNYKHIELGYFKSESEAGAAYAHAAGHVHGEFARS
jgi:hypothetical protein